MFYQNGIAVLSLLAAAKSFVRRVRGAGTLASGGRRTVRNVLVNMRRHMFLSRVPLSLGIWIPV